MQISGISSQETSRNAAPQACGTPSRRRFALAGRSHAFDPRIDAARGDLADLRLADRLFAPHYAAAVLRTASRATPLLAADGGVLSELLIGETFEVLEFASGRAWGVCAIDGSVGHVDASALAPLSPVTHIVCARSAGGLPMGSRLAYAGAASDDIRPIDAPVADFVALAEALVGAPFVAGGRSGAGLDDAGLVFLTLSLAGIVAPRFRDLQAVALGHEVAESAPVLRGDILFHEARVALALDGERTIAVAAEGVMIAPQVDGVLLRRRLP